MEQYGRNQSPYQLIFYHGVELPASTPKGARLIPLLFSDASPESALNALKAADLEAADTKTTAIFISVGDIPSALVAYAAVTGFVGRFLDISAGKRIEPLSAVVASSRRIARQADGRRDETPRLDCMLVSPTASDELPTIVFDPSDPLAVFGPPAAAAVRFARQVVLTPPTETHSALRLLAALAGLRSTTRVQDRFPNLQVADAVVDLEDVRRSGQILRNQLSLPSAEQLVEARPLSNQQKLLLSARQVAMAPVLEALGSTQSEDGQFYRCPRPQNHANGDRNPSMRIKEGKVRCFVCDPEWVDPLQLVLSSRGLAPVEAARWVLSVASAAEAAAAA